MSQRSRMMKVAIIGVGNVGGTLAKKLGAKGHSIFLGTRNPNDQEIILLAKEIGSHASVHSANEAAQKAEVVLLATPWGATEQVVKSLKDSIAGKVLIDCTNPLENDLSGLEVGHTNSGGELVQSWALQSLVYKSFNTTGFNIMADPVLEGRNTIMFYCSDDKIHRHSVGEIIKDVGFEAMDVGPLATARLLEPFALLWIQSAFKYGMGRDYSFGILRKK
jgi:8-hydroxy-5-deazaflavin:NADPH oxidoreductase